MRVSVHISFTLYFLRTNDVEQLFMHQCMSVCLYVYEVSFESFAHLKNLVVYLF